jgi:hypothetical protein
MPVEPHRFAADRDRRRSRIDLVSGLVERRAIEPDDVLVAVVEFRLSREGEMTVGFVEVIVGFDEMRSEVAVCHRVLVVVTRAGLVDVLGRERRHKGQEWRDDEQGSGASHRTSHIGIIRGRRQGVNGYPVNSGFETGQ